MSDRPGPSSSAPAALGDAAAALSALNMGDSDSIGAAGAVNMGVGDSRGDAGETFDDGYAYQAAPVAEHDRFAERAHFNFQDSQHDQVPESSEQGGFEFGSVLDGSSYTPAGTPAPSIPKFDPSKELSNDGLKFLDLVSGSMSDRVIDTFFQLSNTIIAHMPPIQWRIDESFYEYNARVQQREQNMDKVLRERLGGQKLKNLGITKKIVVEVEPIMRTRMHDPRPPPPPLTADEQLVARKMKPDMRTVLPGRLLQLKHIPAGFAPSTSLTSTLAGLTSEKVVTGLRIKGGQDAMQLWFRAKRLFAEDNKIQDREQVCLYQILEEKVEWVRNATKTDITFFDWKCEVCGGRHALQIDEK